MKKLKLMALFLSASLTLPSISAFSNVLFPIKYNSADGLYSAEKISHPNVDVKQVDGIIEYDNGKNDRSQNYSWAAVGHGDYMYVATLYGAMTQTLQIIAAQNNIDFNLFKSAIDVAFNGDLFITEPENNPTNENRSVLLKINIKTGDVKIVSATNTSYRAAVKFNDKLYFAATGKQPHLLEIDPATDTTQIVYKSQIPTEPFVSVGIRGLTVVNGQLVASMIGNNGTYVVASSSPSEGEESFEIIATQEDLLDYPAYHYNDSIFGGAIWDMVEFNNKLYMTVVTGKSGNKTAFGMFCGTQDSDGKWNFELLVGDENDGAKYPYGLGADRSGAANLFVYDNHLYIGGYNDPMIALPSALSMDFEEIYKDLSSPVNLWRMDTEENVELVAGEPTELFPTVLGNQSSGFGSNMNQYVWRMSSHNGKLFLGTFDISSLAYPLMQFTNGDILNMSEEDIKSQINYIEVFLELLLENKNPNFVDNYSLEVMSEEDLKIAEEIKEDSTEILSEAPTDELSTSLATILEELKSLQSTLNNTAYSDTVTASISSTTFEQYEDLLLTYESIKDKLPEALVTHLDKFLNEECLQNIFYFIETCKYLSEGERGFDLLVSEDGLNFNTITTDGFGDPYNHGLRVFATTNEGLCLGTANPFNGTQVWKIVDNTVTETPDTEEDNTNPGTGDEDSEGTDTPEIDDDINNAPSDDIPTTDVDEDIDTNITKPNSNNTNKPLPETGSKYPRYLALFVGLASIVGGFALKKNKNKSKS